MDFRKKKKMRKTIRATGPKSESIMPIIILHNRLDLWYGIINTFFNNIFLPSIFTYFYYIFDPHCPVQLNRENFQVQNFAFLTSELKSTLNFSLENISYSIFWPTFFSHQMSAKPWSDLEPCLIGYMSLFYQYSKMNRSFTISQIKVFDEYLLVATPR